LIFNRKIYMDHPHLDLRGMLSHALTGQAGIL